MSRYEIYQSEVICPFFDRTLYICDALSLNRQIDEKVWLKYCSTEAYDNCPLFLVESLVSKSDV
ncbi:MAG: hypothetical protein N2511_02990 [Thermodesulfovibrionales bacterium]|nr:hypothetical protein [Thermodesulfovibrionales bacterium]